MNEKQGGYIELTGHNYYARFRLDGVKQRVLICPKHGPGALDKIGREKRKAEIMANMGLVQGEMSSETKQGVTFQAAAVSYLHSAMTRKRRRISKATAVNYQTYFNTCLNPYIGALPLAQIKNITVKNLVESLCAKSLRAKTVRDAVRLIPVVVQSILDGDGQPVHELKLNYDFIDLPLLGKQSQPCFSPEQVTAILAAADDRYQPMYMILAATGMRFGEVLAIKLGPQSEDHTTISADCKTIFVRKSIWKGKEQNPKTLSAVRDIDIHSDVAAYLKSFIGNRTSGFLFETKSGRPMLQRNILRDSLHPIMYGWEFKNSKGKVTKTVQGVAPEMKGEGCAAHAFRRFRVTHLRTMDVPEDFIKFWLGHSEKTITDRYSKMKERLESRRKWANEAGLGFEMPGVKSNVVEMAVKSKQEAA
jgi:integrase